MKRVHWRGAPGAVIDSVYTNVYTQVIEEKDMVPTSTPARARVQVVRWGNSQAVRLPKEILKQARLREGDELTVRIENGRIALEPTDPEITLEKLVAGITLRNRHREQDWGRPIGHEVW
jgi:antitoxin MazE